MLCSQKLLRVSRAFFSDAEETRGKRITAELATFDYFAWFKFRVGRLSAKKSVVRLIKTISTKLFCFVSSKEGGVVERETLFPALKNSNTYTTHGE